jgi:iron(III) transport system substrate-binding protein
VKYYLTNVIQKLASFGLVAVATAGISAPATAQTSLAEAAKAEGKLTLYTTTVDAEAQENVLAFEKAYPGIKVEWLRFPSTTLFARFTGEYDSNVFQADVLYSGSSQLYQQRPDLFKKVTAELIPSARNVIVKAKNDAYLVAEINPHAVTYNTALVPGNDVEKHLKSWKDLADPYWKGKIALVDPKISTNVVSWLINMRDTYGPEWVDGFVKNQFKVVGTGTSGAQQVAAGAFQLVVPTVLNHSTDVRGQGAPVAVLTPDGPSHGLENAVAISAKAPHPNAARLYVEWKIAQGGVALLCKNRGVPNVPPPAGLDCPGLSPKHVGSNDTLMPDQQREITSQLGLKQ